MGLKPIYKIGVTVLTKTTSFCGKHVKEIGIAVGGTTAAYISGKYSNYKEKQKTLEKYHGWDIYSEGGKWYGKCGKDVIHLEKGSKDEIKRMIDIIEKRGEK